MRSTFRLLIATTSCCLLIQTVDAQEPTLDKRMHRYALLIGVNDYAPPLGKLEFCQNDMQELQAHFEAAGFSSENVTFMRDGAEQSALRPSKSNVEKQLNLRMQLANEEDIVVVAFSGHGLLIDGKSYLCPSDARLDTTDSLISIDDVYAQMEKCRASQKVLIIDACRNEPIVRGFRSGRLADDLTIEVQSPPKGLFVLSSCEPKQFSAEDAKLQHGVFMYYIMQGLKGLADTNIDIGGNNNGRVSLDELYFYAHEKTKIHVANSHGILQRPVMKGEMVGRIDLAMVPDSQRVKQLEDRAKDRVAANTSTTSATSENTGSVRTVDDPLLSQADAFYRAGDHENAIRAYTAIVDNSSIESEVRKEARRSRGASYLARGGKADIDKALIDQLAAGLAGIRMTIRAPTAKLKISTDVRGTVKRDQTVLITKIVGDWLWVESVDGSDKLQGYIKKSDVSEQPAVAAADTTSNVRQPSSNYNNYNRNNYGNNNYNDNYSNNGRNNNGRNNNAGGRDRPPSVWETPEWETPRQIRERRANGTLR